jgi:23S rRNA pseudouridine1911/1915/1917 synthase
MADSEISRREEFEVSAEMEGERLDRFVSLAAGISRSAARRSVEDGLVEINGGSSSASYRLRAGQMVSVERPAEPVLEPEEIQVPVVFEDEHVLVVDKPAGLVVHPGAGNLSGTLVNALLSRGISGGQDPARPGVVHRLDRDTSGLLALSKSEDAYTGLVAQLSERSVSRVYRAVVAGEGLPKTGTVDSPVGRHPENPTMMAAGVGKSAVTHFESLAVAGGHTMLRVRLETGRTHQIRVHLSAIGHPVYADPMYGKSVPGCVNARLWLHAESLEFTHPVTGEPLHFEAGIPEDLRESAAGIGFDLDLSRRL